MPEANPYSSRLGGLTVAQLLLRFLQLEGATTLFGIPGSALMHILNELRLQQDTFRYIICRQESGAAYIADGYARVGDGLGVLLVTSGPGATNAVTGTMNAQNGLAAILTISGEVPEQYFGMGYLQQGIDGSLDVNAIYRNATPYSAVLDNPANSHTLIMQALRTALGVPRQAAHLSLPDDVAATPVPTPLLFPSHPSNYRAPITASAPRQVSRAFQSLTEAQRPLVFLGNGCRRALQGKRLEMFRAVVEKYALPVMTTPDAKGIFPETHPLSLRNFGLAGGPWPGAYMASTAPAYDALLVLGSSLGELATNKWSPALIPAGPLIQVDVDPSVIARPFPVSLGIVAEIGGVVDDLFALGLDAPPDEAAVAARRDYIADLKAAQSPFSDLAARDSDATPIPPPALMKALNDGLPPGSHLFLDAGNCVGWCLNNLIIDPPTQMHAALSMGPMGFGVGAVIGAKLAAPDKVCVAVVGDGAFLMHGAEVSTAAQYKVGAIWIVLSDNNLAMVSQGMNEFFPTPPFPDTYYPLGDPDIAGFAHALRADAYEVSTAAEVPGVLRQAIEKADADHRPQVIVAHIAPHQIPPYYPPPPSAGGAH